MCSNNRGVFQYSNLLCRNMQNANTSKGFVLIHGIDTKTRAGVHQPESIDQAAVKLFKVKGSYYFPGFCV